MIYKKSHSFICSWLVLLISIVTLLQHHHHDCDGDACMTMPIKEVSHHAHSCGNDCGLHLSGYTDKSTNNESAFPLQHDYADIVSEIDISAENGELTGTDQINLADPLNILYSTIDTRGSPE